MKIVYFDPHTGQRQIELCSNWSDLINQAWRIYFRQLPVMGQVDLICDEAWNALEEVLP